ncbi:MAG: hypothetical protein FWH57_08275 [Oscillospiraceae bacterium]|nr:hypothetical protein [Oscillospiraceae bacterium]
MEWTLRKKEESPWPVDENGEPVSPTRLIHVIGGPLDMELTLNLLKAYGIPHICEYPNNGLFGKLIMGHPPGGMEIYVPETMLEDARNLLTADLVEDEDEDDDAEIIE